MTQVEVLVIDGPPRIGLSVSARRPTRIARKEQGHSRGTEEARVVQGGGHMRAVSSTGALPRSAGNSTGGRVVAAARREGRSPALVVEDIPSGALSPQVESGPSFVPGHRPSTSGSVVHRSGPPSTTVARLPVPGSRGSSRSQAATRPATPFTLLDDMHVSMDGLNLSAVGGSPGGGALEGGSSLLGTSDPLLQTSGISASGALPSISGSGVSPYDENQRLRRELALMRKRYRQLDFELKKELQVPTSPPPFARVLRVCPGA